MALRAGSIPGWPDADSIVAWWRRQDRSAQLLDDRLIKYAFPKIQYAARRQILSLSKAMQYKGVCTRDEIIFAIQEKAVGLRAVPTDWPKHEHLSLYLATKILRIPLKTTDAGYEVSALIENQPSHVQNNILHFIDSQRTELEAAYGKSIVDKQTGAGQVDVSRCLGLTQAAPGQGHIRKEMAFLLKVTMDIHASSFCSGFAIAPTCTRSNANASFSRSAVHHMLTHLNLFATTAEQAIAEQMTSSYNRSDQKDSLQYLFDISQMATQKLDEAIVIKKRRYTSKLRQIVATATGDHIARYEQCDMFSTNGFKCSAYYFDWKTPKSKYKPTLPEAASLAGCQRDVQGILGVDSGQTFTAASFYMPLPDGVDSDPCVLLNVYVTSGVRLAIRGSELLGESRKHASWLERNIDHNDHIRLAQAAMSKGSTGGDLQAYLTYVQGWQSASGAEMRKFYSKPSVIRRSWAASRSKTKILDQSTWLILKSAPVTGSWTVLAIGMDGLGSPVAYGAPASMEGRFLEVLQRHAKEIGSFLVVSVNEYSTSRICPACLAVGNINQVEAMRKLPHGKWGGDSDSLDNEGKYAMTRVRRCPACGTIFHRDTMAANNIASIAGCIVRDGTRPACFVAPSTPVKSTTR